jgi:UDP-N-acetyl-D-mannosaminuronate dehydrogenase
LVVLVDHREFKRLKTPTLKEKVVIDTRGIL